jgi:indoleamine 2,3-dioxygenase
MTWTIRRGFLPDNDPLISSVNLKDLDELGDHIPEWMNQRRVREELVHGLRVAKGYDFEKSYNVMVPYNGCFESVKETIEKILSNGSRDELEHVMRLYSYFASSYVFATNEEPASRIPKEIAVPLVAIADAVGRKPILSYASYCLYNWKKLDPNKDIVVDNLDLIQYFTYEDNSTHEAWFILIHVDIEARAAEGISAIIDYFSDPAVDLSNCLSKLKSSFQKVNATMLRMTEGCSPDFYYNKVRPYIFSFEDVVYEDCFDNKPQTFRGETGAQSSIVPAVIAALGIKHKESILTKHLDVMRDYMPPFHRNFISEYENNNSLRNDVKTNEEKHLYNDCVQEVLDFRNTHLEYAMNYIHKKVDSSKGTGGTPYVEWLSKLVDETKNFFIE